MKKNLLLTCLLTLIAVFGMAQTAQWPITLTKAEGLPGKYAGMNYEVSTKLYSFDEAFTTLRFTVVSTNTVEAQTTGSDGYSSGWGPGFPFFTLSELTVLDANGASIEYVATSNAAAANNDGSIEALNDGNYTNHFHSTYYTGETPQAYHYLELTFDQPIKEFQLKWSTRSNLKNMPTYVGLTPGTDYYSYPELDMQIVEKVTTLEGLAEEGAFFLIKNNAGEYNDTVGDYPRVYPGAGYYSTPFGALENADANAIVYLIPSQEKENTYKIAWLNNGHYFTNQPNVNYWFEWTNKAADAGWTTFVPCEAAEGDFFLTQHDTVVIYHNRKGKLATTYFKDSLIEKAPSYVSYNMSVYKVSINGGNLASQLDDVIADAEARVAMLGYIEDYDQGEYQAITDAIAAAKAAKEAVPANASEIVISKLALEQAIPSYSVLGINAYLDSLDIILSAIESEEIILSEAPDWVEGSYPVGADDLLKDAQDEAFILLDTYETLEDVDAGIAAIKEAIDNFWASKIANVISLPYRVGLPELGLPGELQGNGCYRWESPVYNLTEEVTSLRFTVFATNNGALHNAAPYPFPTYGEFVLFNAQTGDTIKLTADDWSSNSVHPTDGIGLAGLCDNDPTTHYHAAWWSGQVAEYDENPTWVYIEAALPEPVSSFKFVQYGRTNSVNTPIDFAIGVGGDDLTPNDVLLPYPYAVELGEQITDATQIVDGEIYAIRGLYNCDPVDHFEDTEPQTPNFYSGVKNYGKALQAPTVFIISKTGDDDGSFYIRSLKDGSYWKKADDSNGWGNATTTLDKEEAAKIRIEPRGNVDLPGSLVMYEYVDTMKRDIDGVITDVPYLIYQDWGDSNLATFSVTGLDMNDEDGEGEFYINKVNMPEAYIYMLSGIMADAEKYTSLQVGDDPGFYSSTETSAFVESYAKAKQAQDSKDNVLAKSVIEPLCKAVETIANVKPNPVVPGVYVFQSSYEEFYNQQGVTKAMYAYANNDESDQYIGNLEYKMYWSNAPDDIRNPHERFQFELIPATEDENLGLWREAGYITEEDSLNAYYIKHVETGHYIKGAEGLYRNIGLTPTPESPFVIRSCGNNDFDFYCPLNDGEWTAYRCLQLGYHSNGGGASGHITTWYSGSDRACRFYLRKVDNGTSIGGTIINGNEQGDELVSVTYYTVGGAVVNAPVKGINIVKKVYANGVVKSEKILVK